MRIIINEPGVEYPNADAPRIRGPREAADQAREIVGSVTEVLVALYLDAKNRLIASEILTAGGASSTMLPPREVFRPALLRRAHAVILIHNHPSGDPSPSPEDIQVTRQLIEAGSVMGVPILDHLIVAPQKGNAVPAYLSLRESGMVDFSASRWE